MLTEQDKAKAAFAELNEKEIKVIINNLSEIKPFKAHENVEINEYHRAVMVTQVAEKMKEIFSIMKLDIEDPNLIDTPNRISSMWINELMIGRYNKPPRIEAFPKQIATKSYDEMVYGESIIENVSSRMIISKKVDIDSLCSHHFMPFFDIGKNSYGLVAYKPSDKLLGISKLQRVVNHFAARPQLQESLLTQVHEYIKEVIQSDDVMVMAININHTCESQRGVKSSSGRTSTVIYSGIFSDSSLRVEIANQSNQ